ncbi:MAG: GH36 C-terminal domain-containing protein, partial [Clostridia bacterium]|nr:GH36 C-terminal domain-containing protein [Clostridia bacterium]
GLLKLAGLDENADYRDEDTGLVFGGDELMRRGIPLPALHSDYDSAQFFLRKVEED